MDKKENLIREIKNFKAKLSKKISIQKVIFFGSRVRGDAKEWSDVDLIIVSEKFEGIKFRERARNFYKYWNIKYPFEFLCYTPKEFEEMAKKITIVNYAIKEGVEIT